MSNRRTFMAALGGAAAWPVVARAQQPDRVRRIGGLMGWAENDHVSQEMVAAFTQGLAALGWNEGSNLPIDLRWTAGDTNRAASFAKELVALRPDVILTGSTPVTAAIHRETQSSPPSSLPVSYRRLSRSRLQRRPYPSCSRPQMTQSKMGSLRACTVREGTQRASTR
jgi:putative ABC transport system substrate-binding protein